MHVFTWQDNFQSRRADGRHVSSLAALMHQIRTERPLLEYTPGMTRGAFCSWQKRIKATLHQLMSFPAGTPQPSPIRLWQEERDGYRLEKWEFYPDDYFAVPVLMLIPSAASAQKPAPGVLCFPGSASAKELLAGEPGFAQRGAAEIGVGELRLPEIAREHHPPLADLFERGEVGRG